MQEFVGYSMNPLKIMILLWQFGIIDSLTLLQFCINCGAQYTGLTLGEAAGYMGDIGPGTIGNMIKSLLMGVFKIIFYYKY